VSHSSHFHRKSILPTSLFSLLDGRSSIYSSRPNNYIANHLICPGYTHILFAPYGPEWKALRKAVQSLFNDRNLANILTIQNAESIQTVHDILHEPNSYNQHIKRYTTALMLASIYGQRGERYNSPKVQALYDVQNRFTGLLEPGAAPPVDGLTFLQFWPELCAPWKQRARQIRKDQNKLYFQLLNETKDSMRAGQSTGGFMEQLILNQEKSGLDNERVAYSAGVLLEAGSDTTSSTILSFLLGLLQNQEALGKAQADVDRLCGTSRSPSPDDIMSLPYIEACMNEVRDGFRSEYFNRLTCTHSGSSLETSRLGRHTPHAYPARHIQRLRLPQGHHFLRQCLGYPPRRG
jgi:cytochrome P450